MGKATILRGLNKRYERLIEIKKRNTMSYLKKALFYSGLVFTFALGSTDSISNQLNQNLVKVEIELFASADEDSKKYKKKSKKAKETKKKNKKKNKKRFKSSRSING